MKINKIIFLILKKKLKKSSFSACTKLSFYLLRKKLYSRDSLNFQLTNYSSGLYFFLFK